MPDTPKFVVDGTYYYVDSPGKSLNKLVVHSRLKVLTDPKSTVIISVRMLKWVTSLLLLFSLTGQVWAGACGCFDDHNDSHSCCKPDKSGKDSLAAPPCCSADCESMTGSQIPGKNADRIAPDVLSKRIAQEPDSAIRPTLPLAVTFTVRPSKLLGHRLKLARPPEALYLRHNSFLI